MATKYCVNCDRVIEAKRQIGVGTFILAILTGGLWLILIPFYSKRCPMCHSTNFGKKPPVINNDYNNLKTDFTQTVTKHDPMEQLKKLQELKESGVITEDEFNDKKKKILDTI